jgi:uncharacterized alkaline shock family protein YloU
MAAKKNPNNTLPQTVETDSAPSSTITYANEVVAIIAGLAANEVEGIAGMCNANGSILGKNRNVTRGVKVEIGTEEAAVDLYVVVEYGVPIQRAAMDAQESVRKAIESMTGLHVVRVDVHVQSVSFEKENKALQAGAASAALEAGTESDSAPADDSGEETVRTDPVAEKEPVKVSEPTSDMPADETPAVKNETQNPRKKSTRNRKTASSAKDTGAEDPTEIPDKPEENGQGG